MKLAKALKLKNQLAGEKPEWQLLFKRPPLGVLLVANEHPTENGSLMPMLSCQNASGNLLKPQASRRKAQAS